MIRYALVCTCGYKFDAWFANSAAYDDQSQAGLVECPMCHGTTVSKQIMAPAIARQSRTVADPTAHDQSREDQCREGEGADHQSAGGQSAGDYTADDRGPHAPTPALSAGDDPSGTLAKMVGAVRDHIAKHFEYVGDAFANEATAMHDGEQPQRPIYGTATAEEVKSLVEDEVPVAPLPGPLAPPPPKKVN